MKDTLVKWIDFDVMFDKYNKTLPQALPPKELLEEIKFYLSSNKMVNVFGLATHLHMSKQRFTSNYLKSKDPLVKEISLWAVDTITNIAMMNPEDYAKILRYIVAQSETSKSFIELSDEVQEANSNKIIILPAKD